MSVKDEAPAPIGRPAPGCEVLFAEAEELRTAAARLRGEIDVWRSRGWGFVGGTTVAVYETGAHSLNPSRRYVLVQTMCPPGDDRAKWDRLASERDANEGQQP